MTSLETRLILESARGSSFDCDTHRKSLTTFLGGGSMELLHLKGVGGTYSHERFILISNQCEALPLKLVLMMMIETRWNMVVMLLVWLDWPLFRC